VAGERRWAVIWGLFAAAVELVKRGQEWWKARRRCRGRFEHRGVEVHHDGLLVDQPGVAKIIDEAREAVIVRGAQAAEVDEALSRVRIRMTPRPVFSTEDESRRVPLSVFARWEGGPLDRGLIDVHGTNGYIADIEEAVARLLTLEVGGVGSRA